VPIDAFPGRDQRSGDDDYGKRQAWDRAMLRQRITFPVEIAMQGLPRVARSRSLSKAGTVLVAVVFDDGVDILLCPAARIPAIADS